MATLTKKEFRTFRNDKERKEFLDNYTSGENGWHLWKGDEDLSRYWWRCEIDDNVFLVIEEQLETYQFPVYHTKMQPMHYYITPEIIEKPFSDYGKSKTQALDKLKELDRIRKGGGNVQV